MRILIAAALAGVLLWGVGCDLASDAADTTEEGSKGAVGLAEKMSDGTLGAIDEDNSDEAAAGE